MWLKLIQSCSGFIARISLKVRFVTVIFINSFIILALAGTISYYNIRVTNEKNFQDVIQSELENIYSYFQVGYDNLSYVTKQFAYANSQLTEGTIENDLKIYINHIDGKTDLNSDEEVYNFMAVYDRLSKNVSYYTSLTPSIGYTIFYRSGSSSQVLYSNKPLGQKDFESGAQAALYTIGNMSANGIHKSAGGGNYHVISAIRKMDLRGMDDIYVYVETSNQWLKEVFVEKKFGMNTLYIMTDPKNNIVYSGNPTDFPIGGTLAPPRSGSSLFSYKGYYLFHSKKPGWNIIEAVRKSDYDREKIKWIYQFILVALISLVITAMLTAFIWRTIYRPVKVFRREFRLMAENQPNTGIRRTRIREFDDLLLEFYQARASVTELHKQVEEKEKRQKELEIEKLLIQINPHFIHNTLNCIQWMARLEGQKDIEKMVMLFTRVLNFNLGKKEIIVPLNEEINALYDYIELQKMKNKVKLNVVVTVDPSLKEVLIPRFILQPLVENSIIHGADAGGNIFIKVNAGVVDGQNFAITVEDKGKGIADQEITRMLDSRNGFDRRTGAGIGIKYVNGMIQFYYGENHCIQITGKEGKGTVISLLLPLKLDKGKGLHDDDKGFDS